jgi:hypothetical protein
VALHQPRLEDDAPIRDGYFGSEPAQERRDCRACDAECRRCDEEQEILIGVAPKPDEKQSLSPEGLGH